MSKDHDQYDLTANIQEVIHGLDTPAGTGGKDDEPDREERETIHVYPVAGGGVLFTRTPIEEDKEPIYTQNPKNTPDPVAIRALIFSVLIPLSCIIFQLYLLFNPPIATITIIPKSQQIILNGTLQLGRQLNPLTLSQSQITQTTGHGHQDATQATGELIFYNGQATIQTIAVGTIFTGADGIEVATDQAVTIPAGNPPTY